MENTKQTVPNISQVWQAGLVPEVVMSGGRPAMLLLDLALDVTKDFSKEPSNKLL